MKKEIIEIEPNLEIEDLPIKNDGESFKHDLPLWALPIRHFENVFSEVILF